MEIYLIGTAGGGGRALSGVIKMTGRWSKTALYDELTPQRESVQLKS